MHCKHCDLDEMARVPRHSFLERHILCHFGYYPWQCAVCSERTLLKFRTIVRPHPTTHPSKVHHA